MSPDDNESGVMVYPRIPVPAARRDESRQPTKHVGSRGGRSRRWIALLVLGVASGGAGAWFLQPLIAPDPRIAAADKRASDAQAAATTQKDRADALEKSLDQTAAGKRDIEDKLTVAAAAQSELAGKTASETTQHQAAEQASVKLKAAVDKAWAQVTLDGDDVHVQIADRMLWKPNDDALTDRGKVVLGKLAAVLKDLPDRQVWVQGHTDDQPVALPRAAPPQPPAAPAKKGAKPVAAPAPASPPAVRFPTNWELSAARALAVVHYFQDTAKLEPTRLAALAFSQYAPVSKKDKSANRRLELVLVTRRPPAK
ncbi:MAG TPA: OmpA family protein [Kofleriaceae bacterium]|jgi:chemotaxis protein MotB|nr:OmpA family protein [Kofleriaceae bacterium]